jgi:alpha-tubulin suppressor-like RCC1 family protein
MTTKILGSQIEPFTIETTQLSNTAVAAFAVSLAPKVLYANVANSAFSVLDDTAVNVGGGYIVVTGSEFQSGATVLIDTTPASAVTYVNSTTLQVQVPTKAAASYNLYVVNPDGGVGVKVSGLTYSTDPTWVTSSPLSNQEANTAFNVTLSATGASSYSVAAGSTLPAGTSLLANGYFYGTVSIGSSTTYSFSVVATDAENQDSSKTFQVTVNVVPLIRVYTWGDNTYGQLGRNNTVGASSPVQVGALTNWSDVATGGSRYENTGGAALAIKNDGTLWSWGRNDLSLLGTNDGITRSSPTQVGALTGWSKISVSGNHALAIRTNGTLWAWGTSSHGQLGGSTTGSPAQVGTDTNWAWVEAGRNVSFAIRTDGTMWSWGQGFYGVLGHNNTTDVSSSPKQIGTSTDWSTVSCRHIAPLAIKTDGTLWAWGTNNVGQNGLGTTGGYRSSPIQIGSDTTWLKVGTGYAQMYGIKTNGTLWAWGASQRGNIQDNYAGWIPFGSNRNSPSQVGANTNWLNVWGGYSSAFATKTDGTLWAWGVNQEGQLGINNLTSQTSPAQVAGTNWTKAINHSQWSIGTTSN